MDKIRFGCVLATDDTASREHLAELTAHLSDALGTTVEARSCGGPGELASSFGSGQLDLVWASPTLALMAGPLRDGVPMVSSLRQGVPHYHSVLFVRQDSAIRSLLDLKGARAAWVAKSSASGYLFARVALAGHGLDPNGLFVEELFLDHHGAVSEAVLQGRADVGATFASFAQGDPTEALHHAGFMDVAGGEGARVLLPTPAIPSDLVVASGVLRDRFGDSLVTGFEQLDQVPGAVAALREVLGAEGFRRCDPAQLADLRRQIIDAEAMALL